jgi:tRNA 2-thiouridine synthesizing protein B
MLHTINKSPFERNSLASCLRVAQAGSAVLLIEDGVYAALAGTEASTALRAAMPEIGIFVLRPDLEARGLDHRSLVADLQLVEYAGFVQLAIEHDNVQAWL